MQAADIIRSGGLVAIPTETVYGLAANALDESAVLRIFSVKERPHFDPLIVHCHTLEMVNEVGLLEDERLIALAEHFWPGPLTLLIEKRPHIPSIVTSGLSQVGVRIPAHPLTLSLIRAAGVPLAAPSANPFGYISPTRPEHVQRQLGDKIGYILDGGPSRIGVESTIAGLEDGELVIYRAGGLELEKLEEVAGTVKLSLNHSDNPRTPGQLKSHYSPRKPLVLGNIYELLDRYGPQGCSVICFGVQPFPQARHIYNLSAALDVSEAAINLFDMMRRADEDDSELVLAELVPSVGVGVAVNDRLVRAAARL